MYDTHIYYLLYQNHACYTPIHKDSKEKKRGILIEDASCICSLEKLII